MEFIRFEYRDINDSNRRTPAYNIQLELDRFTEKLSIEQLISLVGKTISDENRYKLERITKFFIDPTKSEELQVQEEYIVRHGKLFQSYQVDHQPIIKKNKSSSMKSIW